MLKHLLIGAIPLCGFVVACPDEQQQTAAAPTRLPGPQDLMVGGEQGPFRRLFLDALTIDSQHGLERVFHPCDKYPGNPLILGDTPWESKGSGPYLYGTVMWDGAKLRMWYHFINRGYKNAYAESQDGIHWTKPSLGLIEQNGSTDNNLFLTVTDDPNENPPRKARGQCHNPSVIKRPWIEDQQQRYALFCYGADYDKVRAAFSPDGLRWTFAPSTARQGLFESSDVVNFFHDPYRHRYVATWKGSTRRGRSVGIATSEDGLQWEKPAATPIFTADDLDPPETQIYGMPVFPYQGMYVGLPWIYHAKPHYPAEMLLTREQAEQESDGTMDVQLAWSWDLLNWTRPAPRKSFLPRGTEGTFDSGMIYTARAPVVVDDTLYFYYGGFDGRHDTPPFHGAIGLATLRLDGFCSMRPTKQEGWLITRREQLEVPKILINARTSSDGHITAELLDLEHNVLPGFSARDCIPFIGDAVRHTLRWRTKQLPEGQANTALKIRFVLQNADLYSYLPASPARQSAPDESSQSSPSPRRTGEAGPT